MASKKHELLWQLHEDTADQISELQSEEIEAWLALPRPCLATAWEVSLWRCSMRTARVHNTTLGSREHLLEVRRRQDDAFRGRAQSVDCLGRQSERRRQLIQVSALLLVRQHPKRDFDCVDIGVDRIGHPARRGIDRFVEAHGITYRALSSPARINMFQQFDRFARIAVNRHAGGLHQDRHGAR
jgi:hypothetical protein